MCVGRSPALCGIAGSAGLRAGVHSRAWHADFWRATHPEQFPGNTVQAGGSSIAESIEPTKEDAELVKEEIFE